MYPSASNYARHNQVRRGKHYAKRRRRGMNKLIQVRPGVLGTERVLHPTKGYRTYRVSTP